MQSRAEWLAQKALNPAHGSGRIVQVLSTKRSSNQVLIPLTAVSGYFRSGLFILRVINKQCGLELSAHFRERDLTPLQVAFVERT